MNHHHNPPPILHHRTTTQILRQTTHLFYSHLLTFLLLSTLLFIFRSNVHVASHYLYSLIDSDPSFNSILSLIDFSDAAARQPHHHRHRRRASNHLSRASALHDDFFSGDSDFDRSLFHPASRKSTPNARHVIMDDGVSFPSIVKPEAFGFNPELEKNVTFLDTGSDNGDEVVGLDFLIKFLELSHQNGDEVLDLNFLIKVLELGHQDYTSPFFLAGVLSAVYAYSLVAFIVIYSCASGIIFLKVVDHLLGNHRSLLRTFREGLDIGLTRLTGFILMKWAVRDALAQPMGIYFFGDIEDQYAFFSIFLRIKFMPFSNLAPWVKELKWECSGLIVSWFLIDLLVGLLFSVDSWVAFVHTRRGVRGIVRGGWRLLEALFWPAFEIRCLEAIVCGSLGRWVLKSVLGEVCTMIFQSVMEVYFMVAWLVVYLAVRQMDDAAHGRPFGRRELEGLLRY